MAEQCSVREEARMSIGSFMARYSVGRKSQGNGFIGLLLKCSTRDVRLYIVRGGWLEGVEGGGSGGG